MKTIMLIGIFIVFLISTVSWLVFNATSDENSKTEPLQEQSSSDLPSKNDPKKLSQYNENNVDSANNTKPENEANSSTTINSIVKENAVESKFEKPVEPQNDSKTGQELPDKIEPEIELVQVFKAEENNKSEAVQKKEIYFVNDKNQILFGGKKIALQAGKFDISDDTKGSLRNWNIDEWLIDLESPEYFVGLQHNEIYGTFRFKSISDSQAIVLTNYCLIEVTLTYKEGLKPLPDGTKCILSTYYSFNEEGIIKDNKAIFKTKKAYTTSINFFYAENYFSYFSKQMNLIRGETTKFELELLQGAEQSIRLLDSENNPLSDYYVKFASGSDLGFNLTQHQKSYIANGKLQINETTCKTDKDGYGKVLFVANGQYVCHIFGKKHSGLSVKVVVDDTRKTIDLVLKDDLQRNLKIYVQENGQPYLKEVKATYYDLNEYSAMNHKLIAKSKDGLIELNNLKATKYQFQLSEDEFEREKFEINLIDSKSVEQTFELKKSTTFIHGYVKDKNGKPIERATISLSLNYNSFECRTDKAGYYKIGGLENDKGYSIFISSDYPKPNLPKLVYPSTDEFNITLADKIYIKGIVLGVDGKPIDMYVVKINCYKDKNLKDFSLGTGGTAEKGKFSAQVYSYGYFEITVKLTNAAHIYKIIPILSEEENQLITLQAEEGFSVTGTIRDFDNNLVENASITRHDYRGPFVQNIYDEILKTDKNGYYKLNHCLVGEKYFVVKVGSVPIPLIIKEEDKNTPLNLSFVKSYKLKGSLKSTDKTPHKLIQVVGNLKGNSKYQIVSETDVDGNFVISSITPGEWYFYFNIKTAKGKKKPGQMIKIIDKDEELNIEHDLPTD